MSAGRKSRRDTARAGHGAFSPRDRTRRVKVVRRWLLSVAIVLSAAAAGAPGANAAGKCGFNRGDPAAGEKIYNETCVACHGENGKGVVPGAPDFTRKGGGVLSKPHSVLANHIKNGFREPGVPMAMPPKGSNPDLTDKDIDDVHAYLHERFGCG